MQLLAKRLEVIDVAIDRQQLRVGRQTRKPAAALVVLDHAMVFLEWSQISRERLMIHSRAAVDDDHRRAASRLAVPDPDAVTGCDELRCQQQGEKHAECYIHWTRAQSPR